MTRDTIVGLSVHDVARMIRRDFDRRAREKGLTRSRWQVLWHLARHEGVHQAALAEIMNVAPISLARQLERLEQEGLVARRPDPADRRRRRLYLTEAATPALQRLRELAAQTRERAFRGLNNEQIDMFREVLATMRANLCDRSDQGDMQ